MELKRVEDWSDDDADEGGSSKSAETRPPTPDAVPERKPPVFDLGIIYKRPEITAAPEPVFQERDRSEPEVAQGITPAAPEGLSGEPAISLPSAEEQAYAQQRAAEAIETLPSAETDDDDENTEEEPTEPPVTRTAPAPLPFEMRSTPEPTPTEQIERATIEQYERPPEQSQPRIEERFAPEAVLPPEYAEDDDNEPPQPTQPWSTAAAASPVASSYRPAPPPRQNAGGNFPPPPPPPPTGPSPAALPMPWHYGPNSSPAGNFAPPLPNPNTAPNTVAYQYASNAPMSPNRNYVTRREFDRAQESNRRKMVAAVITSLAIGWYLGRRGVKPLREQVKTLETQSAERQARLTALERERRMTTTSAPSGVERQDQESRQASIAPATPVPERPSPAGMPTPFERPFEPPPQPIFAPAPYPQRQEAGNYPRPMTTPEAMSPVPTVPGETTIIGEDGQEIVLKEGERLVLGGEGQYSVVVDKYNRVVHDRIPHGESYKQDLLPERMPTPFGSKDARFTAGGGGAAAGPVAASGGGMGGGAGTAPIITTSGIGTTLPSGQIPADHGLPVDSAGHTTQEEAQRLLDAPKPNPVVAAITSPWLWLGVGILMIAFFAAATI